MIACPQCGGENPEHAKFCLHCAAPLAQPEQRRMERKYATALFADLVGSTTLAEREDPEVVQSVVGRTFDRLAEEIQRFEGLLEKFMGDAVLAVFGVPRAHEDDAERAVRTAIEMQAVLSELNRGFAEEGKPQLGMRIGVEAGEVLVDQERASGPRDRMLTGDAVNVAARLQTAAEPGRVVVGPGVYAATKDVIEYRELPALDLKGKNEQVPAWEALRIKAQHRGERPSLGMEARLVGRDEELAVLKQTLLRVQSEGRPALVTIVGPAGVGKSRLVQELERYVEGLPEFVYWRRGRCLAYGNTSYSALADAIKAQCEILDDDAAEVAAKKADSVVRELFGDDALAPHIRTLVGAGEARSFSREDLFEAWRRFLERMSARYPLVLVLEDIHWADEGLLDFIGYAADWAQGRMMLLTLARPELFETRPAWGGGKRNATSLSLDPLSPDEGEAMLDDLLGGGIASDVRDTIVERSEGNPLYVEEIVRMLIDDGVLRATEASRWEVARPVADVELPRSIQGLIAARLDGLPEDEKTVLQDAAVVGRVFWIGAVAALAGLDKEAARDVLGRLRVKELVLPHDPSSFSDEQEFAFRHNLIRDGAYDTLPKSLRAEKHAGVARWAQGRAGDRAEEIAELIATHYLEARRYLDELGVTGAPRAAIDEEGYRWACAAGDRTAALWQRAEAVHWYREALGLAEAVGATTPDRASLARRLTAVGLATESAGSNADAARLALDLYASLGDEASAGWAQAQLAFALFRQGKDEEAQTEATAAIARLEPLGESEALAVALQILAQYLVRRGRDEEGERVVRRAMSMGERVHAPVVVADATQTLAMTLSQQGRSVEAVQTIEEAYRLAKEVGDQTVLLRVYNNYPSIVSVFGSDHRRAIDVLQEGIELAERAGAVGNLAWLLGTLSDITSELGDLQETEHTERRAIVLAEESGDAPLLGIRLNGLAWVVLLRGRVDEADELYRQAVAILELNREPQADIFVFAT
ncbi:MAG: AAA family ATPase, partial [Actinomycetota bacterium]